jgi:hypothetical protein
VAPDVLLLAESTTDPVPQRSLLTPVGVAGIALTETETDRVLLQVLLYAL